MAQKVYLVSFFILNALIPIIAVDMPRGLAFAPGLIGLVFFCLYPLTFKERPKISRNAFFLIAGILAVSSLSLLWAVEYETSLKQVKKLWMLLPPQILLISLVCSFKKEQIQPYVHFFSYGVIAAACLLSFELLSNGVIFNTIRGEALNTFVAPAEFNRGVSIMCFYSILAVAFLYTRYPYRFTPLFVAVPAFTVLCLTESQSSQLAIIVGALFFFGFPYRSKIVWKSFTFVFLATIVAFPFLVQVLYQNFAEAIQNLPMMEKGYAGHRLEIWDAVSRYAMQSPLYGMGIETTRTVTDFNSQQIFGEGVFIHPHNFVMQLWIELGSIGILLAIGCFYKLFSFLQKRCTPEQRKILLPTIMMTIVPACLSFGMWQGWWIGVLFHLTAMCIVARKLKTQPLS